MAESIRASDLHRQQQLLDHYTRGRGTLTILWDKDRRLPVDDPLRHMSNVVVCEAALHPNPGAVSLLFPVADEALDATDAAALASRRRNVSLAYFGNQYDRNDAFDMFFAPAAAAHQHLATVRVPGSGVQYTEVLPRRPSTSVASTGLTRLRPPEVAE